MTLTRVGNLDTLIRVPDANSPVAGRVDDVARERLPAALAVSVASAVPTGPEVVVLRRVDVVLELEAGASLGPETIAARWAETAGAAAAAVASRGDGIDVIRFPDEARFAARFVGDLVAGRAWNEWCYGAFGHLRDLPPGAAIARVLADHVGGLNAILGALRRDGNLERSLSFLGADETRAVWEAALARTPQPLDAASAFPIATAAFAVAGRLPLPRPAGQPAELAATYGRWAPEPLDWSDRRALADAVCGAFAEIADRTALPRDPARLSALATAAVRELDWLDRERLVTGIVALLAPDDTGAGRDRTAELRRVLAALASELGPELEGSREHRSARAIRLFAALAARDPELAARADAPAEVDRLLINAVGSVAVTPAERLVAGDADHEPMWCCCDAAGVLLLVRGLADTRLAALASRLNVPAPGLAGDAPAALLLSIGLAVAGSAGVDEDGRLDPALPALLAREDAVTVAEVARSWSATGTAEHRAFRDELAELAGGLRLGRPAAVPECRHPSLPGLARGTVAQAAHLALMAWSRWLPGLADSTPAFLLGQLLRRGGSVSVSSDAVRVVLDPRPLDAVVELAGYLDPLERVPWLGQRSLELARGAG